MIILVGALLLMLPISSKERVVTPFLSALFTTTSATCVTGLTLINVGAYFQLVRTSGDTVFNSARRFGIYDDTLYCVYSFKPTNRTSRNRMLIAQTMGTGRP